MKNLYISCVLALAALIAAFALVWIAYHGIDVNHHTDYIEMRPQ